MELMIAGRNGIEAVEADDGGFEMLVSDNAMTLNSRP